MITTVFSLDENYPLAQSVAQRLGAQWGELEQRQFPDGESYLRVMSEVAGHSVLIVTDLSHPNAKYLPLTFLAGTLKDLGAKSVGLVTPYLPYMRQDKRFNPGEAVTSRIFAQHLGRSVDWLVTIDPHLHRYHSLDEIYAIPSSVVHGARLLAQWLKQAHDNAFLVGPDAESEQWVSEIAAESGHPFVIGSKVRRGDRSVDITLPEMSHLQGKTAVVIDDVISSGQTIMVCTEALRQKGIERVECAAVHGLFADDADRLLEQQLDMLVTTNSIAHSSNQIDVTEALAEAVSAYLK